MFWLIIISIYLFILYVLKFSLRRRGFDFNILFHLLYCDSTWSWLPQTAATRWNKQMNAWCLPCCVHSDNEALDAGLLARSQYPEGPATGHLDTGFSWFPYVYKRMMRWFPSFQVATTCLSCSLPNLNFLVTFFSFRICVHAI